MSEKHHLLAWVLSVETARKYYPETALFTDDEGAHMLIEGVGLEFTHVSTELNALRTQNSAWWVLGKLYTYRAQTAPFIHIDSDVFLWQALPKRMTIAPVCAQSPEHFPLGASWYRPEVYDDMVKDTRGWLPKEWNWYVDHHGNQAICCGILGGNHIDFINHYADTAIRMIEHPRNQHAWSLLEAKIGDNILFEQYFLCACLKYHQKGQKSPYRDIDIQYLFESSDEAFTPDRAKEAGYTHMIAGAKRNKVLGKRLEQRVARDYPEQYERCTRYLI